MLEINEPDLRALKGLMRRAPKPYVRRKATALWNLAQGRRPDEVAEVLGVSQTSLFNWLRRYRAEGIAGLQIRPGRGRPPRAKAEEIESVLRQSPRNFGIPETRWTLSSLAQVARSEER